MNRTEIRAAIDELGMGLASNTVRPPKASTCLGDASIVVTLADTPLRGAVIRSVYSEGVASDGFKSNYERRPRWWVVTTVEDQDGHVCWSTGTRFSNKDDADQAWDECLEALAKDGEEVRWTHRTMRVGDSFSTRELQMMFPDALFVGFDCEGETDE